MIDFVLGILFAVHLIMWFRATRAVGPITRLGENEKWWAWPAAIVYGFFWPIAFGVVRYVDWKDRRSGRG